MSQRLERGGTVSEARRGKRAAIETLSRDSCDARGSHCSRVRGRKGSESTWWGGEPSEVDFPFSFVETRDRTIVGTTSQDTTQSRSTNSKENRGNPTKYDHPSFPSHPVLPPAH